MLLEPTQSAPSRPASLGATLVTVAQLATGLAAIGALYLTGQSLSATQDSQYSDRFGKAVEQLGSDKLDVRLGGIFALERLSKDSVRDSDSITEILSAYLRERAKCAADTIPTKTAPPPTDIAAVFTVLGRRPSDNSADLSRICLPASTQLFSVKFTGTQLNWAYLGSTLSFSGEFNDISAIFANFEKSIFIDTVWRDASLNSAGLTDVTFVNNKFTGIDFRHSDLKRAKFTDAVMLPSKIYPVVNFAGADLTGADASRAQLVDANLGEANLTDANFSKADLSRARLTGATLKGARFSGANLQSADLSGQLLTGVDLTGANLRQANLRGADLRGARLENAQLDGATLDGAIR